jgi:hypothetical protein
MSAWDTRDIRNYRRGVRFTPESGHWRGHSDVRFVPKADITMILTASLDKCGFCHHKQQMFCLQIHGTPRAEGR